MNDPRQASVRCGWVIFVLFLVSGACGLVYEVVWTRMLTTIFGHTVLAAATVLASFMAGLGLGSILLGRFADRRDDLLRIYGWLEIAIGVAGALVPSALVVVEWAYVAVGRGGDAPPALVGLVRFALSFAVVLVPTSLMGGTLPVLSRFLVRDTGSAGRHIGLLYALNTLGAVGGTLAAGFVLISSLGMVRTTSITVALNLAVGLTALLLHRLQGSVRAPVTAEQAKLEVGEEAAGYSPALVKLALVVLAVSGFAGLAYEVVFFRILVLVIGTTVYAFSTMLAAFLCGIALGSALFSLVDDRTKTLLLGLGLVQILLGWVVLASVDLFGKLPRVFLQLTADAEQTFGHMQLITFAVSFLLLLFPTMLLGASFPIVSKIVTRSARRVGSSVGRVYVWNTGGGILGSLAAGFLLIPTLGIQASALAILTLNLLIGAVTVWFEQGGRRAVQAACAVLALAGVGLAATRTGTWDRETMVSGVYLYSKKYLDRLGSLDGFERRVKEAQLAYYAEGLGCTVSVLRHKTRSPRSLLSIQIEGETVATSEHYDMRVQRTIGHLPIMLCPEPKEVLVIGLGAGVTAGACARHHEVSVEIVELEPAVLDAARVFAEHNYGVVDDPDVRIVINDGRNYLLMTDRTYDVITVDPIHPFAASSASLYSLEFYQLCRDALRANGVMCQWLPLYEVSNADVAMIMRTFQAVFPHTSVWLCGRDVGLIGVTTPLVLDLTKLEERMQDPAISESLKEVHLGNPYALVSRMILGEREVAELTAGAALNEDDRLRLEFSSPKSMYSTVTIEGNLGWMLERHTSLLDALDGHSAGGERLIGFDRALLDRFVRSRDEVVRGYAARPFDAERALQHFERAVSLNPDDPDAVAQLTEALMQRPDAVREQVRPQPR